MQWLPNGLGIDWKYEEKQKKTISPQKSRMTKIAKQEGYNQQQQEDWDHAFFKEINHKNEENVTRR